MYYLNSSAAGTANEKMNRSHQQAAKAAERAEKEKRKAAKAAEREAYQNRENRGMFSCRIQIQRILTLM